jgi:hypothetical protein
MTDSTTAHTWIARAALRMSSSSGSPLAPPKASPCVLDLLGRARFQAHAAMDSVINLA